MDTPQDDRVSYILPMLPLTATDLENRRAAATGSMHYARLTAHADYNGHHVVVSYRPHAIGGPRWVSEYYWGERVVLARGSLEHALEGAKAEYDRGARGTLVVAALDPQAPEQLHEQRALCAALGMLEVPPGITGGNYAYQLGEAAAAAPAADAGPQL